MEGDLTVRTLLLRTDRSVVLAVIVFL